jgi:hypothetical protein
MYIDPLKGKIYNPVSFDDFVASLDRLRWDDKICASQHRKAAFCVEAQPWSTSQI